MSCDNTTDGTVKGLFEQIAETERELVAAGIVQPEAQHEEVVVDEDEQLRRMKRPAATEEDAPMTYEYARLVRKKPWAVSYDLMFAHAADMERGLRMALEKLVEAEDTIRAHRADLEKNERRIIV